MKVLSVCSTLPTAQHRQRGIFVYQRLSAMSRLCSLRAFRPQPWFPWVRGQKEESLYPHAAFDIDSLRMFYLPGIAKSLDGWWMQRCVRRWIDLMNFSKETTVVDAHFGYPDGVGCYRVAQQLNLPVFITIRGLEQPLFGTPIGDQIVTALNGCTGVIAVSESLRVAAIDAGVNPENIKVIPNGVDHSVFTPPKTKQKESTKLLVSVGNLKKVKGHDILLRAFSLLNKKVRARLVVIGVEEEPAYATHLRQLASHLQLEESVEFTGSLPENEISRWLQRADLFVLASRREGCCNAVLEALACGVPVVATKVGDNAQYVHEGISGRLVEIEDERGLAKAIETTLLDSHDESLIASTVAGLSWQNTANNVLQYFQERLSA